ncbi:MAG TPA: deoxyribodipyrimidine photo-lyase, partial [Puia sp.]|nr:deoxyribodipyrimidine photo-lyase [Puia sp.]
MKPAIAVFWLRRDLRLEDNAGLYHALKSGIPVLPVFVFDRNILDLLENKADRRVEFIYETLTAIRQQLRQLGSGLGVYYGRPPGMFRHLLAEYDVKAVYTNTDYEPYAIDRDRDIGELLAEKNIPFHCYKDQVIFEKKEVLKDDGTPYTIFTPYSRRWKALLNDFYLSSYPVKKYYRHFLRKDPGPMPSLASMGFKKTGEPFPPAAVKTGLLRK